MRISYLIAAHNEKAVLESSIERLIRYLADFKESGIYIVENGSKDDTYEIAQTLASKHPLVRAYHEPKPGMGYGHHRGILEALGESTVEDQLHWLVLNSADLPFGNSDLQSFAEALASNPQLQCVAGSKAHPSSQIQVDLYRKLLSIVFYYLRHFILGMKTRDSQGVLFLRADLARKIYSTVKARDFFHMTELVLAAERLGIPPLEVPVIYRGSIRPSKVRPIRDGLKVLFATLEKAF